MRALPPDRPCTNAQVLPAWAESRRRSEWHSACNTRVLIPNGEPAAADALRVQLREELGWASEVAEERAPYAL